MAAMKKFYNTLAEKDKRRYAAVKLIKAGHGGAVYLAALSGKARREIVQGLAKSMIFKE